MRILLALALLSFATTSFAHVVCYQNQGGHVANLTFKTLKYGEVVDQRSYKSLVFLQAKECWNFYPEYGEEAVVQVDLIAANKEVRPLCKYNISQNYQLIISMGSVAYPSCAVVNTK